MKKFLSFALATVAVLVFIGAVSFLFFAIADIQKSFEALNRTPGTSSLDYWGIGWGYGIGLFTLSGFGLTVSAINGKIATQKVIRYGSWVGVLLFLLLALVSVAVFYI